MEQAVEHEDAEEKMHKNLEEKMHKDLEEKMHKDADERMHEQKLCHTRSTEHTHNEDASRATTRWS